MADSDKKKRRSKQEAPIAEPEPEAVVAPVEDSAAKSKSKSKKKVVEASDEGTGEAGSKREEVEKAEETTHDAPVSPEHVEAAAADDSAVKSKRKSKKSVSETTAPVQKEEVKEEEAVPIESKPETDSVSDKKSKKRSGSKTEVVEKTEKEKEVPADSGEMSPKRDAPKRRKSTVGKFFDRIMGKEDGKEKDKEGKDGEKDKATASSSKEHKKAGEEVVEKASSSSKASKSSKKEEKPAPKAPVAEEVEEGAAAEVDEATQDKSKKEGKQKKSTKEEKDGEDGEEAVLAASPVSTEDASTPTSSDVAPRSKKKKDKKKHKEETKEEQELAQELEEWQEPIEEEEEVVHVSAPPPRIPPPSAPIKAPAGSVKQGPEVTAVFSMKPQIKVEVGEVEEATEYAAEDAKREIDFQAFCTAKPQYTIGKELTETAYNRSWEAKNNQGNPADVLVKFYSHEPPRMIPSARVLAHVDLLNTISQANSHVLPLLDSFIGEEYEDPAEKAKRGKESVSSSDDHAAATDEVVEHEDEAPVKSNKSKKGASGDAEAVEETTTKDEIGAGEDKKKDKKKKKKAVEEDEVEADSTKKVEAAAAAEAAPKSGKKDKKKKKGESKESEEVTPVHPEPKIKMPPSDLPSAASEPKLKTQETDHILVFERLPDSIQWASSLEAAYTEHKVASIILGVLQALQGLHAAGYMHRAVSPTNVVVTKDGEARLTGFDFACKIDAPSGNVLASEQFKAPEIAHSPSYNQAVDLWGVGALTYFLLTGKQLFRESNNARLKIAIRDAKINYDEADWAGISPEAQALCKSLLVKDVSARPSLQEVLENEWVKGASADSVLAQASANLRT